ncbi:ORF6N domain-containing protein [Providencia sp. PROV108]|uniref:ORF6N domain-containing protein n=1 Tax=Providencia sp. PROV108 TaxID=2949820 RepID=UPI00234AE232|nr:ORF6N domain-containing protein [Providencia sp. PROV108]
MSSLTVQNLPPVQHNGFRVITTELLANVYETEINNIQQNFKRNKKRFIEGKHYFKIVGDTLNNLRLTMSQLQISAKVRSLILWTERGAARHAKMLDTDNAWDVFEALEDFYFSKKEDAFHKTTTDDRAPLRNAVDCLMTKKRLSFPKAYGYVHAKYGVNSIDEVPLDLLPEAVDYIYKVALEGEYLPKQAELPTPKLEIDYPLTWYPDNFPFVDMCFYKNGQLKVTQSMLTETKSPSKEILSKLESAGYDVTAAKAEIESLRHTMIEMSWALGQIASFAKMKDVVNKTFTA